MIRGLTLATSPILFIFRNFHTDFRKKKSENYLQVLIYGAHTHTQTHIEKRWPETNNPNSTHQKIKGSLKQS